MFSFFTAGHIHGVLWIDMDKFIEVQNEKFNNDSFNELKEAWKSVNNDENLSTEHLKVLEAFADLHMSCTIKSPGGLVALEVNKHHHTKTCEKRNTKCRFGIPRYVSLRTIFTVPAKILYPEIEEREKIMDKVNQVLEKVKDILENENAMKELCSIHKHDVDFFLAHLATLDNEKDETRFLESRSKEIYMWRKTRIIELLKRADIETILDIDESLPEAIKEEVLLEEYTKILKVSTGGYSVILERDVDEVYINNFNEEWIRAWNGNMDIQMTPTFHAVVTYITDYSMKDDSGTTGYVEAALEDSKNEALRQKFKIAKNTYLTHRQMGEPESYYRLFPSFHLSDSNISTLFIHTGSKKSKFLKALTKEEAKRIDPMYLINLDGNEESLYVETPNIRDKYLRRPQILEKISLAQFAKRYITYNNTKEEGSNEVTLTPDQCPEDYGIKDNFLISPNASERSGLPRIVQLVGDSVAGESNFLKIRKPLALRFHKFKKTTEPHEFYLSEMELYKPFRKDTELHFDDFENCERLYNGSLPEIQYVKSHVMEFLENVEEARENAQEIINEEIAAAMDAEAEQDNADCNEMAPEEGAGFVALDPESLQQNNDSENVTSEGPFKRIEILEENILRDRTDSLDNDQKFVIDIGITYAKDLLKSRGGKSSPPTAPLIIVQGGGGSGKSHVIDILSQWVEYILRTSGDSPNQPYVLKVAYTGTAAAKIGGQTISGAFNIGFGNKFTSLADKTRDLKRTLLSNLCLLIIDEYSMLKADLLYQLDRRLRELKNRMQLPFGGCSIILFGDLLQLR